jgi:drug/metabolite transporter (DMT)-like permease
MAVVAPSQAAAVQWALIAAMAVWGLNVSVVKALTTSFEPLPLASLRMVVACATLSGLLWWQRCRLPRLGRKQAASLLGCAVLMVYANQILFAEGLLRSTAANGALIMATSPLASSLMAALVFRERMTLQRIFGVVLGFTGVAAVVLSHPGSSLSSAGLGDLMLVLSVVSFAAGGVVVQRLARELHPLSISWAIYVVGTVMLVVHTFFSPSVLTAAALFPGAWPWLLVLFSGVAATALGNLVWNRAIAAIGVARTAVFLYWVPIFGIAFAALLLGEPLTWWHLGGFIAVMAGTWLGTRQPVLVMAPASASASAKVR